MEILEKKSIPPLKLPNKYVFFAAATDIVVLDLEVNELTNDIYINYINK